MIADARAIVLTGTGRYADPWHRFAETTARLVEILAQASISVEVAADVDARKYRRSRIVYDALGHDTRSYESPTHRELIRRAASWALGG